MALYRVDTVFPFFTGDPSDVIVNTLHFESTANHADFATNVEAFLFPFWVEIYSGSGASRVSYVDWENVTCRVFNLEDPTPRVPIETPSPFIAPGTSFTSIPTEVAVVLSFQSQGLPGEVFQRRYNRIYLGAVPTNWLSASSASTFPVIASSRLETLSDACKALADSLPGPATRWVQVSNAAGSPRSLPVIKGYVDDSPDTQRRRSVDSQFRENWVIDPV